MELIPGNAQWIGIRGEQQDAFGFFGFDKDDFRRHGSVLAVLADGMGGMRGGRDASQLAVRTMIAAYGEKRPDEAIADALRRSLTATNRAVCELARYSGGEGNLGTTLVAIVVQERSLYWVAAGDSRLYLYRGADGSVAQCTQDHNYGEELLLQVASGELSREEAEDHPDQDALTSFVGMAEIPKVDCNLRPVPLSPGDRLLLCSDGLYGVLATSELNGLLASGAAQQTADAQLDAVKAKRNESQDNATAALIECRAETQRGQPPAAGRKRAPWTGLIAATGIALLLGAGVWLAKDLFRFADGTQEDPEQTARRAQPAAAQPAAAAEPAEVSTKQAIVKEMEALGSEADQPSANEPAEPGRPEREEALEPSPIDAEATAAYAHEDPADAAMEPKRGEAPLSMACQPIFGFSAFESR